MLDRISPSISNRMHFRSVTAALLGISLIASASEDAEVSMDTDSVLDSMSDMSLLQINMETNINSTKGSYVGELNERVSSTPQAMLEFQATLQKRASDYHNSSDRQSGSSLEGAVAKKGGEAAPASRNVVQGNDQGQPCMDGALNTDAFGAPAPAFECEIDQVSSSVAKCKENPCTTADQRYCCIGKVDRDMAMADALDRIGQPVCGLEAVSNSCAKCIQGLCDHDKSELGLGISDGEPHTHPYCETMTASRIHASPNYIDDNLFDGQQVCLGCSRYIRAYCEKEGYSYDMHWVAQDTVGTGTGTSSTKFSDLMR